MRKGQISGQRNLLTGKAEYDLVVSVSNVETVDKDGRDAITIIKVIHVKNSHATETKKNNELSPPEKLNPETSSPKNTAHGIRENSTKKKLSIRSTYQCLLIS